MTIKETKHIFLALFLAITIALTACGSGSRSSDVPTLQESQPADEASSGDAATDNEAMMMAFTECLREQGLDVVDPVLDADGNIGKPAPAGGWEFAKGELEAAMVACTEVLEGLTFAENTVDVSAEVDAGMALAACLRERGHDVADPTAETLDQWQSNFKFVIDLKDETAVFDYETCSAEAGGTGGGK